MVAVAEEVTLVLVSVVVLSVELLAVVEVRETLLVVAVLEVELLAVVVLAVTLIEVVVVPVPVLRVLLFVWVAVDAMFMPPPHWQHASEAVLPKFAWLSPSDSHMELETYQSQVCTGPVESYHA